VTMYHLLISYPLVILTDQCARENKQWYISVPAADRQMGAHLVPVRDMLQDQKWTDKMNMLTLSLYRSQTNHEGRQGRVIESCARGVGFTPAHRAGRRIRANRPQTAGSVSVTTVYPYVVTLAVRVNS